MFSIALLNIMFSIYFGCMFLSKKRHQKLIATEAATFHSTLIVLYKNNCKSCLRYLGSCHVAWGRAGSHIPRAVSRD